MRKSFAILFFWMTSLFAQEESDIMSTGRLLFFKELEKERFACSFLGEGGVGNGRIGATFALQLDPCHRVKFSSEYLIQKLTFGFSSGRVSRWVQQGAVGLDYQWLVLGEFLQAIDATLYGSYAPSKRLSPAFLGSSMLLRNIAGSALLGGEIAMTWIPIEGNCLKTGLSWDHLSFRRKFSGRKTILGPGIELLYTFQLPYFVDLTFEGQWRRPFTYLGGRVSWGASFYNREVDLALFGGHTQGRDRLPNSSVVGIELSYPASFGRTIGKSSDFIFWAGIPAVYMPEVLVISEERKGLCRQAPSSDAIPPQAYQVSPGGGIPAVTTIPLSSFFHSALPLTYTVSAPSFDPGHFPITVQIDPSSGVLMITDIGDQFESSAFGVTVIAQNRCGSTSALLQLYPQ